MDTIQETYNQYFQNKTIHSMVEETKERKEETSSELAPIDPERLVP